MKRKFMNPEITRIEIRLTENIATSDDLVYTQGPGLFYSQKVEFCMTHFANTDHLVVNQGQFGPNEVMEIWYNCLSAPQSYEAVKMMLQKR